MNMNTAKVHQLSDYRQGEVMPKNNNYTQLPNWIADTPMTLIERSMLTIIARKSIGFHKNAARISLTELMELQQVSKNTILKTQKILCDKGWLKIGKTNGGRNAKTTYSITPNPDINGSAGEPLKDINGSAGEPLAGEKTVHPVNGGGSSGEPFRGLNGSPSEHASIKENNINKTIKETPQTPQPGKTGKTGKTEKALDADASCVSPNQVAELFNAELPELPAVKKINPARKTAIKARKQDGLETLENWQAYFAEVRASDFLMGRTGQFVATFDWLIKPANVLKVQEGNYRNRAANNSQQPRKGIIDEMLEDDFDRGLLEHAYRNREIQP